jgi:hypothetical protein
MKKICKALLMGSLGILGGCASSYNEQFDCAPGSGIGCKSLSQVNDWVDKKGSSPAPSLKAPHPIIPNKTIDLGEKGAIVRIPEETLHVLVVGYRDDQGSFHENAIVHMVSKEASWGKIQ